MCTALTFRSDFTYFGRNLDLERSFGERAVVTPRNFPFNFRHEETIKTHSAIIGMALVVDNFPLYFDAANEDGLFMAGLNFPQNACYFPKEEGKINLCPFELIPFILSKCKNCDEASELLERVNIVGEAFSENLPITPLHWFISDKEKTLVLESVREGLRVYENPVEVLTNSPPFNYHLTNLNNYASLHEGEIQNNIGAPQGVNNYSLGLGALGLPGDFSSQSRFVKAAFVKLKALKGSGDRENINQFFHILSSVAMPKGCVKLPDGQYEYTRYSSCINAEKSVYCYTTYENRTIVKIDMHRQNLDGTALYVYTH